ncbi:hypothetical protein Pelo_2886 [Pelomyxa schiedti]|nr:hypothetical protein Pelo_2886 [Pelomyxa schiedti]
MITPDAPWFLVGCRPDLLQADLPWFSSSVASPLTELESLESLAKPTPLVLPLPQFPLVEEFVRMLEQQQEDNTNSSGSNSSQMAQQQQANNSNLAASLGGQDHSTQGVVDGGQQL